MADRPNEAIRDDATETDEVVTPLPSLPARLAYVFFSPGKLNRMLAENPKWVAALLASTVLIGLAVALIPTDLLIEAQRQRVMERGGEFPELSARALQVMRIIAPFGAMLSTLVFTCLFAGLYSLIFVFILGDEGGFKQYLAVVSHAYFIPALFGLLVTPLRISTSDPQLTLNLSTFLVFLPDGYLLHVFKALDITQIWSTLVIAQGAHAIDRRRGFGSAAAILLSILLVIALIVARFI